MMNLLSGMKFISGQIKGMVLLEILILSFILSLIIIPMAALFFASSCLIESANKADAALYLAQGVMEDYKSFPYQDIKSLEAESIFKDYPDFSCMVEVVELNNYLKKITVSVSYLEAGKEKRVELTSMIADYKDK